MRNPFGTWKVLTDSSGSLGTIGGTFSCSAPGASFAVFSAAAVRWTPSLAPQISVMTRPTAIAFPQNGGKDFGGARPIVSAILIMIRKTACSGVKGGQIDPLRC